MKQFFVFLIIQRYSSAQLQTFPKYNGDEFRLSPISFCIVIPNY